MGFKIFKNKYSHLETEAEIATTWESSQVYAWDATRQAPCFIVDTPPPTVSGSLHVGHAFSYTQTDIIARFQRMLGKKVYYPMGWDDNGLPTERRVQNYFGIRCEPHLSYEAGWKPNFDFDPKKDEVKEVSRKNFIEACAILTLEDEKAFERMWRKLGLSVDWKQTYATIDKHCQIVSQYSFLDLVDKKFVYNSESPTTWDTDFKSAIAQAEIEDRERPGAFHEIEFAVDSGESFIIATTRPEMLPACIAVVAHPDDERYKKLFGKKAITPLFHAEVPILPAEHADPEKGTGILMVCTFGDIQDVEWWKQSGLPIKQILGRDGRLKTVVHGQDAFVSRAPELANKNYSEIQGLFVKQAQKKIVELLASPGSSVTGKDTALIGEPKPVSHPVKFYEKARRVSCRLIPNGWQFVASTKTLPRYPLHPGRP